MTTQETKTADTSMAAPAQATSAVMYNMQGTLLEACECGVLCPCWVGEDPDDGECHAFIAYNITTGEAGGVDVSGLSLVAINLSPGNVLEGDWRQVVLVDDRASEQQRDALLAAFSGELGGPLADLAQLVSQVYAVESVPIAHQIRDGSGVLTIPGILEAHMTPYLGPDGSTTTLRESVFSTVPGSPAYVGKASLNKVTMPQYGMEWEFEGRNAIQSDWTMEHRA